LNEQEIREAQAAIQEVFGERLTRAVLLQCQKQARRHEYGIADRFREYVSIAIMRGLAPSKELLTDKPAAYVSTAIKNAINDAERHGYVTRMTAKHQVKGQYVDNLAYALASTQSDDSGNSWFEQETSMLAWRNSVAAVSGSDGIPSRVAVLARVDDGTHGAVEHREAFVLVRVEVPRR